MWSKKVFIKVIIGVVGVLVLGYFAMVLTSIDTYYPGTTINGVDYGFKSPVYVDNQLYNSPSNYNLEVRFRDGTKTINGKSVGISVDRMSLWTLMTNDKCTLKCKTSLLHIRAYTFIYLNK